VFRGVKFLFYLFWVKKTLIFLIAYSVSPDFFFFFVVFLNTFRKAGKGKAIPLQALTGPEGSRRLRLPNFKTVGT